MDRRAFLFASLGVAGFGLAGCGSRGAAGPVLKVGSQKGGAKALMLAAGVLEGAPYRVEWSEFPAAQHLLEAIGAGAVDLGGVGDAPFLFAFASGGKVRAVHASKGLSEGAGTALLVRKDSPIRSITELRGRKVAIGRGSIGHYLLLALLERDGLKPTDVEITFLSPGDAKAAFSTGAIDAWVTWAPYLFIATRHEGARILADGRGLLNAVLFEAANVDAIDAKRPQIEDFLRRLSRAQRWNVTHNAESAKVLAKDTGLDEEIARLTAEAYRSIPVPIDASIIEQEHKVLERFRAAGAITSTLDIAQAFDTSFNDAIAP